jgi:hypothetical protein
MFDDILKPPLTTWMQKEGWTTADFMRALRPGGPLDTLEYSTHCTQCGKKFVGTFRQYGDGLCSCGGKLDTKDVAQWLAALRANDLTVVRRITTIRQIENKAGSDD